MSFNIPRLFYSDKNFYQQLDALLELESDKNNSSLVDGQVAEILTRVKSKGDLAVIDYTQKFDGITCSSLSELELDQDRLLKAWNNISAEQKDALVFAKKRIEKYHQHQKIESWSFQDSQGHCLGQQVNPLQRVGMYVPGGKASYPSSVLMNAIPAKVAGVSELVMVVPAPNGEISELVLAAASLVKVDRVFTIGGAQAVAALAFGTETIPKVDKIVGPGNQYVASAKKQVFGRVGIDMLAGPSEILIYCDGKTNPDWIAMDLFSQAEHDELAQALLIAEDDCFFDAVEESIKRLLPSMDRVNIITQSLKNRAAFLKVNNQREAITLMNYIAPEHLELSIEANIANELAKQITHAGAIFIGRYCAEAFGDYCAGSNHVLPTSGSARFSSPLSVYDFVKRTSLIYLNQQNIEPLVNATSVLANAEGLQAHALSAEYRRADKKNE
jgi:histidinol dehydrogenase